MKENQPPSNTFPEKMKKSKAWIFPKATDQPLQPQTIKKLMKD